jgi:hypothetical protein
MLGFAFHTPGADVTQGMRAPVTSVPLRHRANHRSGVAGRRFRPIRCYRIEISVMTRDGVRSSWSHQIDYLLRRYGEHVRVISSDHRGHGRSSGAPISTYRIEQLASDLADVLVTLEVSGSVTLCRALDGRDGGADLSRPARPSPSL